MRLPPARPRFSEAKSARGNSVFEKSGCTSTVKQRLRVNMPVAPFQPLSRALCGVPARGQRRDIFDRFRLRSVLFCHRPDLYTDPKKRNRHLLSQVPGRSKPLKRSATAYSAEALFRRHPDRSWSGGIFRIAHKKRPNAPDYLVSLSHLRN